MDDISAKLITLAVLIVLTILFGCLPYFLVLRGSRSCFSSRFRENVLACLNCFAGGVFLGTFLLHLMTEGAEEFDGYKASTKWETNFPFFNTFVFGGLFLVALMEHFMHSCLHHNHSHDDDSHGHSHEHAGHSHSHSDIEGRQPLLSHEIKKTSPVIHQHPQHRSYGTVEYHNDHEAASFDNKTPTEPAGSQFADGAHVHVHKLEDGCPTGPHCDPADTHQGPEHMHHQAHGMQAFLLLMALSFHTIFDGLAVGLQKGNKEVWSVFAGISVHKAVIAFCLGYEMFKKYVNTPWKAFLWMCMFSIMSPFGIALGIGLEAGDIDKNAKALASSILQGVAAGVFLYVTFLEILCSYMGHSCVRGSKFIYYICTGLGFGIMAFVKAIDVEG